MRLRLLFIIILEALDSFLDMPVVEGLVLLLLLFPKLLYQKQLVICELRLRPLIFTPSSLVGFSSSFFVLRFPDLLNVNTDVLVEVLKIIYVVLLEDPLVVV